MARPRQPRLILSPCGTSLLTNGSTDEERRLLNRHTNTRTLEEMGSDRAVVEGRIRAVRERLQNAIPTEACRASAELNGILTLCAIEPPEPEDHHILLCTDTWLGEQTGQIVEGWLRDHGHASVELRRQPDLQTADLELFQSSLSDLVHWLGPTIEGYRGNQYRVLFNLTGGFKSVQGFLQTLGNLYADETLYIFESSASLLRIPRLPVRLDIVDTVRRYLTAIRRLANGLLVSGADLLDVPETFWFRIDGRPAGLSPWGAVVWEQSRKELYGERVWECPSNAVRFADSFLLTTRNQPSDRLVSLNDKLDKLAAYLEGNQTKSLQSLDLKELWGNPKPPSTYEFDAWADRDAKRVFCHYDGTVLVLDRLDNALH